MSQGLSSSQRNILLNIRNWVDPKGPTLYDICLLVRHEYEDINNWYDRERISIRANRTLRNLQKHRLIYKPFGDRIRRFTLTAEGSNAALLPIRDEATRARRYRERKYIADVQQRRQWLE